LRQLLKQPASSSRAIDPLCKLVYLMVIQNLPRTRTLIRRLAVSRTLAMPGINPAGDRKQPRPLASTRRRLRRERSHRLDERIGREIEYQLRITAAPRKERHDRSHL
jgi:hypothetical protein